MHSGRWQVAVVQTHRCVMKVQNGTSEWWPLEAGGRYSKVVVSAGLIVFSKKGLWKVIKISGPLLHQAAARVLLKVSNTSISLFPSAKQNHETVLCRLESRWKENKEVSANFCAPKSTRRTTLKTSPTTTSLVSNDSLTSSKQNLFEKKERVKAEKVGEKKRWFVV